MLESCFTSSPKKTDKAILRVNNFDLIRLIAALQVMAQHSLFHMGIEYSEWIVGEVLKLFPGVLIFFFISGFLISKSYENNSELREYAQNRFIRIYPALIVCTFLSISSVFFTGYFSKVNFSASEIIWWVGAQISFLQFYGPDFMRGYGVGVLNGSLGTISIELQFYILIPLIYWILFRGKTRTTKVILIIFILMFVFINQAYIFMMGEYRNYLLFKLWGVSFFPWFYMFLIGILFQRNFEVIHRILHNRFGIIALAYTLTAYFSVKYLDWNFGNYLNPVLFLMLAALVFSLAYSFPTLSNAILKKNDFSYGVYIYHMVIVNGFIYYGYVSDMSFVVLVWVLTIIMAILSWFFIEKPSMRFKRNPLNPLYAEKNVSSVG